MSKKSLFCQEYSCVITTIEKLVIKDVVKYKNETIEKMKEVTEWK